MSDLSHPPTPDGNPDELFARFIDRRIDAEGLHQLEEMLRNDPEARARCADRLLFEADLKEALDPRELEWLETRQVRLGRRDGHAEWEIRRSQQLRIGRPGIPVAAAPPGRMRRIAVAGAAVAVVAALAAIPWLLRRSPEGPILRNSSFESTDLSFSATGNTFSLIDWQDYFSVDTADLCEIARVSDGRIFAKSGRNVARLKGGAHLTQRLRRPDGSPIKAVPGQRFILSGWVYVDGAPPHVLRTALRVVASGWPAMIQYEATQGEITLQQKAGWQPFRLELTLGEDLERFPSDRSIADMPRLDLNGRDLVLSIDSRGHRDSILLLDDLRMDEESPNSTE